MAERRTMGNLIVDTRTSPLEPDRLVGECIETGRRFVWDLSGRALAICDWPHLEWRTPQPSDDLQPGGQA